VEIEEKKKKSRELNEAAERQLTPAAKAEMGRTG
jgi:hypothetical protein